MTVLEAFEQIEAAAQGNDRLEALKNADSVELRELLTLALSPDVTFGIKKLPAYENKGESFGSGLSWSFHLKQLLNQLKNRTLTGNAAQEAVNKFLAFCNPIEAKWAERILRQDLRLNIGAKDVNKALGKNTIYLFEVPLATDYAKVKEKDLKGKWVEQAKFDGGRCVAIIPLAVPQSPIRLLSRTGKEWGNFESIRAELTSFRQSLYDHGYRETLYVDGEVVSVVDGRIDFQSIQKTMMRKDGVEVGELHFYAFDMCDEAEWKEPTLTYLTRLEHASYMLTKYYEGSKLHYAKYKTVTDPTHESMKAASIGYVERRFEGAMYRMANECVVNKRSKTLLKVKNFTDAEATVIGVAELQREGKGDGILGALQCKTDEGIVFEIGTGLDDKARAELWAMRDQLPGKTVSFKFFELTNDRVPRLPVYRSLRSEDDIQKEKEDE